MSLIFVHDVLTPDKGRGPGRSPAPAGGAGPRKQHSRRNNVARGKTSIEATSRSRKENCSPQARDSRTRQTTRETTRLQNATNKPTNRPTNRPTKGRTTTTTTKGGQKPLSKMVRHLCRRSQECRITTKEEATRQQNKASSRSRHRLCILKRRC